jgi:signal transduction histidine kinase
MSLPKFRFGLRLKITAYISLLIILTAAVLGWFLVEREVETLATQLEEKGKVLARSVANASEYGVITGDVELFQSTIDGLMLEPDVAYGMIYDSKGKLLGATPAKPLNTKGISTEADAEVRNKALDSRDLIIQRYGKDKRKTPVYDIAAPIQSRKEQEVSGEEFLFGMSEVDPSEEITEKIGTARIGISLEPMNKAIREARLTVIGVTSLVVALAILATVFLAGLIVDPVQQLLTATGRVAGGDLDKHVEIYTNDEIGDLGVSFNKMTEDLKRYRTELEEHSRTLEHTVEERTKALRLTNAELQKINQELETVSRHKSEFLANMSHELRTPLNAIIGFSEILFDQSFGELNDKQLSYTENVTSSGKHLLTLINDILDLAKVESGTMNLHLESFPVAGAIAEIAGLARGLAAKKEIKIKQRLSPRIATITADRKKFKQIFYNLLSNAIKFTPEGGAVEISSKIVSDLELAGDDELSLKGSAEFCVKDSGIGIDEADQETIFEEFHQVDGSHSREYEGTGLGLALSRRLVELHGGSIWLESEKGKGSSFFFTFPMAKEDVIEPEAVVSETRRPGAESVRAPERSRGKAVILVVEDDEQSYELIATYLEDAGYDIVRAATAEEALQMAYSIPSCPTGMVGTCCNSSRLRLKPLIYPSLSRPCFRMKIRHSVSAPPTISSSRFTARS